MGFADYLKSLSVNYPNIAYLYATLGYCFVTLLQIAFKYVCRTISPFQTLFLRAFSLFWLNSYIMGKSQESAYIREERVFRQMLKRLMFSTTYAALVHYCVKYLPVSTVASLSNTGPVFIFFVEAIYYKKPLNKGNLSLAVVSFIGVLLILQPEFLFAKTEVQKIDNFVVLSCMVVLAALCFSMTMLYIHDLSKKISTLLNLQYSYMGHMILASVLSNFDAPTIDFDEIDAKLIFAFCLVVLFALLAQYMIYAATSLKEPSLTMPLGYVAIIVGFIADVVFFDIQFNLTSILGIFLTSAGLLSRLFIKSVKPAQIQQKKQIKQEQEQEKVRRRKSSIDQQFEKI